MIPVDELHLALDIAYSNLNSNKKLDVLPEVKDIILNKATMEFINNVIVPLKNPERLGFEATEVIYSKLQRLVSDKQQVVYFGKMVNDFSPAFSNEICQLPYPMDNLKEVYYGYTFKPYNQLEFIKGTIKYRGDKCKTATLSNTLFETVNNKYIIIPLKDIVAKSKLVYITNTSGLIHTTIDLTSYDLPYMTSYSDDYKFLLIKHIIEKIHSAYELGSPYRIEIAYEQLEGIYAQDSIIIKDNTPIYLPNIDYGTVNLCTQELVGYEIVETVIKTYAPIDFPLIQSMVGTDTLSVSKIALYSNKNIIDISDNYYYNKNKIKEVPVSFRNNIYIISNLLPTYIPLSITYTYIRKPILIDSYLNQGLELEEDVDTILANAARLMTAYTSNPNSYQISNNEQLKS